MNEQEWLTCSDPQRMLHHLQDGARHNHRTGQTQRFYAVSDRKLRLFADAITELSGGDSHMAYEWMLHPNEWSNNPRTFIRQAADCGTSEATQAALLRDLVGNPFRPHPPLTRTVYCDRCNGKGQRTLGVKCGTCDGTGQTKGNADWLTPTVIALAQAAYEERGRKCERCKGKYLKTKDYGKFGDDVGDWLQDCPDCGGTGTINDGTLDPDRLAVLSDALEESHCLNAEILDHLRDPGLHWRGCWVLDIILEKA